MSVHIILGDVHLGKGVGIGKPGSGTALNSRIQDQINLLNWVLAKAEERQATSITITGDVYEDPRPHPTLIHLFMLWLKQCERSNIAVHIVAGNHDIIRTGSYTISALDIVPAVELPHAKTYKDIGVVKYDDVEFTFIPFRDRRMYDANSPEEALNKLKSELDAVKHDKTIKNVAIGHLSLEGAIPIGDEIDDTINEIFCPLSMFRNFDYVWMGHIHKPQVLDVKPHMAHIGSMDRSDFHDSEILIDKRIIVFDPSKEPEEIIIPTRNLRKIEINVPQDKDTTDFIINHLFALNKTTSLKDSIIRLNITIQGQESPNADRDKVIKFVYNKLEAHYICNFSESRNISVMSSTAQVLFDSNISIPTAIHTYADTIDLKENKDRYLEISLECLEEFNEKNQT